METEETLTAEKAEKEKKEGDAYERVQKARSKDRLHLEDLIEALFEDFVELKGDRLSREDSSILGGIAFFHGLPVTVIGHRKGRTTEENIRFHFGMASPEGYRKARRLMEQAEKFGRPILTFIDTPGAYPGMEAETNGQANAIAELLACMSALKVPVIAVLTGEGGSGGALALAVADRVWMFENAVYSILSPEGFASILWKDASRAGEAAGLMKLTAGELLEYGLIDEIIPEGKRCITCLDRRLWEELELLGKVSPETRCRMRYLKFREIGHKKDSAKRESRNPMPEGTKEQMQKAESRKDEG